MRKRRREMIEQLIDNYVSTQELLKKDRERSGCFSPSLLGACYRRQVWNRQNEPISDPVDKRTLRVFAVGNLFHDFIQDLLPNHQCEVEVKEDDVSGRADIVTEDEVIDIKTVHSKAFWYSKRDGYDVYKEKFNNILQVCYYALRLGRKGARLAFISKDDFCIDEYTFVAEKWRESVESELNSLRVFWASEHLPPAEPRLYKGKECQYCQWATKCKEVENGKT